MKPIIIDNFLPDLMHKHIQKDIELIEYNMLTNVSGVKDRDIEVPNVNIIDNQLGLGKVIFDGNKGPIELERFPLVVVVPEKNALDTIDNVYKTTRNIIPTEQQTVLFRLDNKQNYTFNQYIKENNLNNMKV